MVCSNIVKNIFNTTASYLSCCKVVAKDHVDRKGHHTGNDYNYGSHTHSDALEVACTLQDFTFFLTNF